MTSFCREIQFRTSAFYLRHSDVHPHTAALTTPTPLIKLQAVRTVPLLGNLVQQTGRPKSTETNDRKSTVRWNQTKVSPTFVLSWFGLTSCAAAVCWWNKEPAITKHATLNLLSSFMAFVYTFLFFPRSHDSFPPLPMALWTPFRSFHEYIYVFAGEKHVCCEGCRALCAGRLYRLWQELPTGASSPWQNAAGPVLPPSSKLAPAKQIRCRPPSPLLCRRENDRPGHCAQRPFTINDN